MAENGTSAGTKPDYASLEYRGNGAACPRVHGESGDPTPTDPGQAPMSAILSDLVHAQKSVTQVHVHMSRTHTEEVRKLADATQRIHGALVALRKYWEE